VADTNVHLEYYRQFLCVLPLHLGPTNLFNNKHVNIQGIQKHSLRKQKKPEKRLLTTKTKHTRTQPTAPFWTSKSSLLSRCETNATQTSTLKQRQRRSWNVGREYECSVHLYFGNRGGQKTHNIGSRLHLKEQKRKTF